MTTPIYELGDLVTIRKGKKAVEVSEGPSEGFLRYIQIEDLRNNDSMKYARNPKGPICDENDVLIAWDGAKAGTVGFGLSGLVGSTIAILEPNESVYAPYLGMVLQSKYQIIRDACTGATIPHVSKPFLLRMKILLPSISEQKRIAAILDKAEGIKEKSGIAYDIHESIARSYFLDMFGDVRINNHNHPTMNLDGFCEIVNGSTPSSKETSYWDGDIPWVSPVTLSKLKEPWLREPTRLITKEGYESCSTTMVEQNSILFSSRAPIGLVAIASMPVCTNQGFKTLTGFNKYATPEYMYQLMKELGDSIASRGRGATFSEISKSAIAAIEVPIP